MWVLPAILVAGAAIFVLDRTTDAGPVRHLYYLPIILAGQQYGRRGGWIAALTAIVLYHLAHPELVTQHYYGEADILQICLFVAAGLVAAKLAADARLLRELATTDDLTGLHNLRSFEQRFLAEIRTARRKRTPLALLVLDLDHLKRMNDGYGHLAGAEAVRTVGHIVARRLPKDGIACRYGGDEFVVVLPRHTEPEAVAFAAELCRTVHTTAPVLQGRAWPEGTLSISAGIAFLSSPGEGSPLWSKADQPLGEEVFRAADAALYCAKASGRNRACSVAAAASVTSA